MPTEEDRIATLERKVAMLELLRSQDERKAEAGTSPAQTQNLRELNENLTMLLGVVGSQGRDIKTIQEDVSSIKDRLDHMDTLLTQILTRLPEKP